MASKAIPRDVKNGGQARGWLAFPEGCHTVLAVKVCAPDGARGLRPSSDLDRLRCGVPPTVTGNPALDTFKEKAVTSNFPFLTKEQIDQLLAHGRAAAACREKGEDFDPFPIVKLFTPDAGATWLLSEIDPEAPTIALGLADLGLGFPEVGLMDLNELREVRGMMNLPIEQDLHFRATHRLSEYARQARMAGRIQA